MAQAPTVLIGFSGPATIRKADEIADRLKRTLTTSDRIEIDCSELEEVDVTFIQLIAAARKSAAAAGKHMVLSAPAEGCLLEALNRAGIQPTGSQSFWFQGRTE